MSLYSSRARGDQVVNQSGQTVGERAPPAQFGTCAPDGWSLALES